MDWRKKGGEDRIKIMVFNFTYNIISVSSRWYVLLVDRTGVPGEITAVYLVHLVFVVCLYALIAYHDVHHATLLLNDMEYHPFLWLI